MITPIKHHFIPQCYLKLFSSDNIQINFYDKVAESLGTERIRDFCQIENLYTLTNSPKYYIETDFFAQKYEQKLAKILSFFKTECANSQAIPYDKQQRNALAKQIVLQYKRTPLFRDTKSKYELESYCEILKESLSIWFSEIEEVIFEPDNIAEYHKTILLEEENETIDYISEAFWELLYTNDGEFYSSDNPIVAIPRNDMPVTNCDAIRYFTDIYYPLNPNLALHINSKPHHITKRIPIRDCINSELHFVNSMIAKKAVRYIIYSQKYNI